MTTLTQLENRIKVLERIVLGEFKKVSPVPLIVNQSLNAIAKVTNQNVVDIISSSRKRTIIDARSIVINHLKENTRMSLQNIGTVFGGKNHSTIRHALYNHSDLVVMGNKAYLTKLEKFNELMKYADVK